MSNNIKQMIIKAPDGQVINYEILDIGNVNAITFKHKK